MSLALAGVVEVNKGDMVVVASTTLAPGSSSAAGAAHREDDEWLWSPAEVTFEGFTMITIATLRFIRNMNAMK
jgi:hypothetical protein